MSKATAAPASSRFSCQYKRRAIKAEGTQTLPRGKLQDTDEVGHVTRQLQKREVDEKKKELKQTREREALHKTGVTIPLSRPKTNSRRKYKVSQDAPLPSSGAYKPVIQNVVARCDFGKVAPLSDITAALGGRYDPHGFPAASVTSRYPVATVSMTADGHACIAGSSSYWGSLAAAAAFSLNLYIRWGVTSQVRNFGLINLAATGSVGHPIHLFNLQRKINLNNVGGVLAAYVPGKFPGLKWPLTSIKTAKVVVCVFTSGKYTVVGCNDAMQFERMAPVFDELVREAASTCKLEPLPVPVAEVVAKGQTEDDDLTEKLRAMEINVLQSAIENENAAIADTLNMENIEQMVEEAFSTMSL